MAEPFNEELILDFIKKSKSRSVSLSGINRRLGVSARQRKPLRRMLTRMTAAGMIEKGADGKYGLPAKARRMVGKVHGKAQGYAFVEREDGQGEDVFIRGDNLGGAMHRDRVEVQVITWKKGGRMEGRITKVLERANKTVVGYYETMEKDGRVVPSERKISHLIYIPHKARGKARKGDVVLARITQYPGEEKMPRGEIVEVLGKPDQDDIELKVVIHKYGIPYKFPPRVLEEAVEASAVVEEGQVAGREDFREHTTFTIDGETARDFDDAVSLRRLKNGNLLLGIHIADVSHYVVPGSALDDEAQDRGNSVYFPNMVIPMLPHELSNGICSLNPKVDRLTMSVIVELTPDGEPLNHRIVESVIRSKARLTYTIANRLISGDTNGVAEEFKEHRETLSEMADLAAKLRSRRVEGGSMDFDLPEPEVVYDDQGGLQGIVRAERNEAHRLIEDFMLLANKVVARHISDSNVTSIYRTHQKPDPEKLKEFAEFAGDMGYNTGRTFSGDSSVLQRIIREAEGKPESLIINNLLLRAMQQAKYTVDNIGHFALAFEFYTHFTSPIRRYPDLVVHRILKQLIKSGKIEDGLSQKLKGIAEQSSARERTAVEAEREVMKLICAEFMANRIDEEFDGKINGVITGGLFIELEDHFIEGFIHVSQLKDDYYYLDQGTRTLVGERKGHVYNMGDRVRVRVTNVSIQQRHIDLSLVSRL